VKRVGVSNHNIKGSSEKGGVLDYCKEQGIEFWAYMVLEQGALSGKYNKENPLPAKIQLTAEEVARLEALADTTGIDTRGGWEHSME